MMLELGEAERRYRKGSEDANRKGGVFGLVKDAGSSTVNVKDCIAGRTNPVLCREA